jgi:MFS family permease
LVGITYGIRPYGHSQYGWANPFVIACLAAGVALLVAFVAVERHVAYPMFDLRLFRIRSFAAGNIAQFLAAVGRGGMQFMLIIWFQGIWLPLHGYAYKDTPLWSGIYMLPWMLGFMVMGPLSGAISDRVGARLPATLGMLVSAAAYGAMMLFPANFSYPAFAVVMLINGLAMGLFTSPNTSAIMNSLPPQYRGVGSGMRVTFGNVGMPLSMGIFFSLMVAGLNQRVPPALYHALLTHGVSQSEAAKLAALPPLGYLFAAFLGYNPFQQLLGPRILAHLSPSDAAVLTSKQFFPTLIGPAFVHGLSFVLWFAVVASLIAAAASGLRGQRYVWAEMDGRVTRAALSPGTLPSRDGAPAEGRDGAHTGARPLTSEPTSSGETLP